MSEKQNHRELYEAISDLIYYCDDNALPRTQEMLIVCIAMLCNEEGNNNSLDTAKICPFPKSRPSAAAIQHGSAGYQPSVVSMVR